MKKFLRYLIMMLVVTLSINLVSCSSSDDVEPETPQVNEDVVFMSAGGTRSIEVGSNWTITKPSECTWCEASINGSELRLTAEANNDSESRSTIFLLKRQNTSKKVTVLQYPIAEVTLSDPPETVSQNGGSIEVTVNSNIPFEVSIPAEDQTWVKCSKSRGSQLQFTVSPNTEIPGRSTTVSIIDADENVLLTFVISQKGNQPANIIYYTTTNGSKILPRGGFGGNFNIVSHTYLGDHGIIEFDGNIIDISSGAFANSIYLVSMSLPEGIHNIHDRAYAGCENLKEINIPGSTEFIGESAFQGCTSLSEVDIPEGCLVAQYAFKESGLETVNFPINSILPGTFEKCVNLKSVTLQEGMIAIAEKAFSGCTNLRTINIPSSLTYVYSEAFSGCSSIESLSFGPGVSIKEACFQKMTGRVRFYPQKTQEIEKLLKGFEGYYDFPADANPEFLLGCARKLGKKVRFAGTYASEDGRCLIVDGKLYVANLRDYDRIQYNFPRGIVKVMDKAVILKAFHKNNSSNIKFLFFADGLEEMGYQSLYADVFDANVIYTGTYPVVRFPKSFKRFTSGEVLESNIGWYAVFDSTIPPVLEGNILFDRTHEDGTCFIMVPPESVNAYKEAWPNEARNIRSGSIDDFVYWTPYN